MKKKLLSILVSVSIMLSLFVVNSVSANVTDNTNASVPEAVGEKSIHSDYKSGEIIVKYKSGTSKAKKSLLKTDISANTLKSGRNGTELIKVKDAEFAKYIHKLKANPDIQYVVPNYTRKAVAFPVDSPDDPSYSQQWGLNAVKAPAAWAKIGDTSGLNDVKVAVIDTGMDLNHEDLKDRISDDGYDFCDMDNDPSPGPVKENHATHVAGIIAASTNNGIGVSGTLGTVPVKIMPLRVLDGGTGDDYAIAQAIYYAVDHGARVINMSFGGPEKDPYLEEAVNYAVQNNVVVVAAAGNTSEDAANYEPASIPGVVTVSAIDKTQNIASFSNFGSVVELTAPGVDILSTVPGNGYASYEGTSMSTPFVSAAAALLLAKNPGLLSSEVEQILYNTAKDLGTTGKDTSFGYGLVDLEKAMDQPLPQPAIQILNLTDDQKVAETIEVQTRYTYPGKLKKLELYVDATKTNEMETEGVQVINTLVLDTSGFSEGNHILKVIAYDDAGMTVEKSVRININNTLSSGIRTKITHNGAPVAGADIIVWHSYRKIDGSTGCDLVKRTTTDAYGLAEVPGSISPNGNEYLVIAQYNIWGDDYCTVGRINKVTAPGRLVLDEKELVPVNFNADGVDGSISGNYKIPGSDVYLKVYFDFYLSNKAYMSAGTYKYSVWGYRPDSEGKMEQYLLTTPDTAISSTNNSVTFDSQVEHLSKLNVAYNEVSGFSARQANVAVKEEGFSTWYGVFFTQPSAGKSFYVTPGSFKSGIQVYGTKDGKSAYLYLEGENKQFAAGENTISFGGNFTAAVTQDKDTYITGETANVNSIVTDDYGNRRYSAPTKTMAIEVVQGQSIFEYSEDQKSSQEIETSQSNPEWVLDLIGSSGQVVLSKPVYTFDAASVILPQNLPEVKFSFRTNIQMPQISAQSGFAINRSAGKDTLKIKVGIPGDAFAKDVTLQMINLSTGKVIQSQASDLLNGEAFISASDGNYRLCIHAPAPDGLNAIFLKDVQVPGEYTFESSALQKVRLSVLGDSGNVMNQKNVYYLAKNGGNTFENNLIVSASGEAEAYVQKGRYNFGVQVLNDDSTLDRAIFKTGVEVGEGVEGIQFTSDNLAKVSITNEGFDNPARISLSNKYTGFLTGFKANNGQKIMISKGLYNLHISADKSEGPGAYHYYLNSIKNISANTGEIKFRRNFSVYIIPLKFIYRQGETLSTMNVMVDDYWNRLVTMSPSQMPSTFDTVKMSDPSSLNNIGILDPVLLKDVESLDPVTLNNAKMMNTTQLNDTTQLNFAEFDYNEASDSAVLGNKMVAGPAVQENTPAMDTTALGGMEIADSTVFSNTNAVIQNHTDISPFVNIIKNATGKSVFYNKSSDYYKTSRIKLDVNWTSPGIYKVELSIGIGPEGTIKGRSYFIVIR